MVELKPGLIRQGWLHGTSAREEVAAAAKKIGAAKGSGMEDLQATLTRAGSDMDGVLEVTLAVIDEFDASIEECLETWQRTDGRSDGRFHGFD